ncbi:hypothetical protein Anacy_3518 [Anabaena cylindrica PCC 7122]|uniref:Uncharacterized protein n=1 Tax=Anabaena cylindrica (strain ATCC 27899 / PCC 7122) TaxID=272123 RepID=K9ZKQ7_ANACC|nr:hypothetical protein Anacy_3518 [Anabaena cylindrica PCC 7122]BAY04068.1 hypothetical protein NIES19_33290 [Anabaena cylindrica PCC 7122]
MSINLGSNLYHIQKNATISFLLLLRECKLRLLWPHNFGQKFESINLIIWCQRELAILSYIGQVQAVNIHFELGFK